MTDLRIDWANRPAQPTTPAPNAFYVGLDLGQSQDYSALAIAEQLKVVPTGETNTGTESHYHVRHLQRWPLGTSYPDIVADVAAMFGRPPLDRGATLVVDATGVGPPVVDLLRTRGLPCNLEAVTITGGDQVVRNARGVHVPKRDLVSVLQVLLQSSRLKIAAGLAEAATLGKELEGFTVRISDATGHDSYGVWRSGSHDDLVLAVALACWSAEAPRRVWGAW